MSLWQAALLGIIQGITEFFPVSSSAHLLIFKKTLGISELPSVHLFDLSTHVGTLIALTFYMRQEIVKTFFDKTQIKKLFFAILPLFPAYFLLKPIRELASQEHLLGFWLFFTSLLLFLCSKNYHRTVTPVKSSFLIGSMQSIALIPGISRSASTIFGGKLSGLSSSEAVRFSFLLSIPTICGGMFLEGLKALKSEGVTSLITPECLIGSFTSLITGLIIVRFAFKVLESGRFKPFAWYCLTLSIVVSLV